MSGVVLKLKGTFEQRLVDPGRRFQRSLVCLFQETFAQIKYSRGLESLVFDPSRTSQTPEERPGGAEPF